VSDDYKFDEKKFKEDLHDQIHRDIHDRIHQNIDDRIYRRMMRKQGRRGGSGGMFPGMALVIVGTVILLQHMGIVTSGMIWTFWPILLIGLGLFKFMEQFNRVIGVLLILVGAVLLTHNLGLTKLSWGDIWPIVIIGAGLMLIWSRIEMPKFPPMQQQGGVPVSAAANTINEYSMFGAVQRRVNMNNFAGGTVSALFGGVELDFRSADIEGEEAVILMEVVFGGAEFVVPDRWTVVFEGQSMFGGYADETRPPLPDVSGTSRKRLILRGRAVFGGITVKN